MVAMPKKEPQQSFSAKNKIGMSPIISFRPLNKVGLQGHTSLGTNLGAIHDSGHDQQYSGSNPLTGTNDEERGQELLKTLLSAKKEMEILENLKTLALDIFNMTIQVKNGSTRQLILERYLGQLKSLMAEQDLLSIKSTQILNQFIDLIQFKLKAITDFEQVNSHY